MKSAKMTSQRLTGAKKAGETDILKKNLGRLPLRKKTGELRPLKIKMVQKDKGVLALLSSWIEEDGKDSTKRNAEWKKLKKDMDDERHSEEIALSGANTLVSYRRKLLKKKDER